MRQQTSSGDSRPTTKQLESDSDDISQVLPHLLHVRLWINANKAKVTRKDGQPASRATTEDRDFLQRLENAETTWQKWWDIIWQNTTYLLATLLNPIYRTKWFKEALRLINIDSRVIQEGLDRTKRVWLLWHQQRQEEDQITRAKETLSGPRKRRTTYHLRTKPFETIYELNKRILGDWDSNDISEYEEYINQPVTLPPNEGKDFKPLSWWCEDSAKAKWPHLSSLGNLRTLISSNEYGTRESLLWWATYDLMGRDHSFYQKRLKYWSASNTSFVRKRRHLVRSLPRTMQSFAH